MATMDLPGRYVTYLGKRIGARGAGSDGEAAAASYVLRVMRDNDIEVDTEPFSTWKSDLHGLLIVNTLAIAAFMLYRVSYPTGLAFAVLAFFLFQVETYGWAVVSKLLPRSDASNVVGRIRPAGSVKRRVVLMANYDTARSSPLGAGVLPRMFRLLYVIAFTCIVAIMLDGIAGVGAALTKVSPEAIDTLWIYTMPFTLYLLAFTSLIAFGETRGRYSAGANDNASGLAVMLSIAGRLAESPLDSTEVWTVATARGCAGGRGAVAFIHRHGHVIRDSYIISIDHCGSGPVKIATREGTMFGFRCSWKLRRVAGDAARRVRDLEPAKARNRVKKGDGMAAIVRGYRAITVGGFKGGAFRGWKSRNDTTDTLDRKSLDLTCRLVLEMLDTMDAEAANKRRRRIDADDTEQEDAREAGRTARDDDDGLDGETGHEDGDQANGEDERLARSGSRRVGRKTPGPRPGRERGSRGHRPASDPSPD